jgi:hypothetical protein
MITPPVGFFIVFFSLLDGTEKVNARQDEGYDKGTKNMSRLNSRFAVGKRRDSWLYCDKLQHSMVLENFQ